MYISIHYLLKCVCAYICVYICRLFLLFIRRNLSRHAHAPSLKLTDITDLDSTKILAKSVDNYITPPPHAKLIQSGKDF